MQGENSACKLAGGLPSFNLKWWDCENQKNSLFSSSSCNQEHSDVTKKGVAWCTLHLPTLVPVSLRVISQTIYKFTIYNQGPNWLFLLFTQAAFLSEPQSLFISFSSKLFREKKKEKKERKRSDRKNHKSSTKFTFHRDS